MRPHEDARGDRAEAGVADDDEGGAERPEAAVLPPAQGGGAHASRPCVPNAGGHPHVEWALQNGVPYEIPKGTLVILMQKVCRFAP